MLMETKEAPPYTPLHRSPSGLFTKRSWEIDMAATDGSGPVAEWSSAEREREFARWVHGEAKALAAQLDRLAQPEVPRLAKQLQTIADALWADAEWARRRIDGSLTEAALP